MLQGKAGGVCIAVQYHCPPNLHGSEWYIGLSPEGMMVLIDPRAVGS